MGLGSHKTSALIILLFFIGHWYLSLFFQTFFLHRYAAHKVFTMSRTWEKIFFVLSWIGQGSSYLSPWAYGIMHRQHHAYADTEKDPHSPKYDKTAMAMMFRSATKFNDIFYDRVETDEVFTKGVPKWMSFDRFANKLIVRLAWAALYVLFYIEFATEWWMFLLLPIHFLMGPVHGIIINWCAHKFGYTNFKADNTSKNFLPVDFLMMGESYHNNHHENSANANFGSRWFEIDPTYPIIWILDKVRIIRLKKQTKSPISN
jgi:stearoyl-CoA desaturase (delta-9 desaturase)